MTAPTSRASPGTSRCFSPGARRRTGCAATPTPAAWTRRAPSRSPRGPVIPRLWPPPTPCWACSRRSRETGAATRPTTSARSTTPSRPATCSSSSACARTAARVTWRSARTKRRSRSSITRCGSPISPASRPSARSRCRTAARLSRASAGSTRRSQTSRCHGRSTSGWARA